MADLAGFSALFMVLCSSPGILRQPPLLEFGTFFVHVCLMVLELASLEKEKKKKKKKKKEEEEERR